MDVWYKRIFIFVTSKIIPLFYSLGKLIEMSRLLNYYRCLKGSEYNFYILNVCVTSLSLNGPLLDMVIYRVYYWTQTKYYAAGLNIFVGF